MIAIHNYHLWSRPELAIETRTSPDARHLELHDEACSAISRANLFHSTSKFIIWGGGGEFQKTTKRLGRIVQASRGDWAHDLALTKRASAAKLRRHCHCNPNKQDLNLGCRCRKRRSTLVRCTDSWCVASRWPLSVLRNVLACGVFVF